MQFSGAILGEYSIGIPFLVLNMASCVYLKLYPSPFLFFNAAEMVVIKDNLILGGV